MTEGVAKSSYLRVVAGLALLAALIISVDGGALLEQFARFRLDYVALAAACIIVATFLGSGNAYLVVAIDAPVSYGRFVSYYWLSWALGLVVPGQIGDIASLTYLMNRAGLDWRKIVARALLDKLISFAVMVALAGAALLTLPARLNVDTRTLGWIAAILLVVVFGGYLVTRVILPNAKRGSAWLVNIRSSITDVSTFVRDHPALVTVNLVGTTIKILLIGTAYWFVFMAGGAEDPRWLQIVLLVTVSSLVAYIPISFNGLGTVEITGVLLFSLLDLGEELVLSSYLVLRVVVILVAWIPALPIFVLSGKQRR